MDKLNESKKKITDILKFISGTSIGTAITIGLTPFITRLYAPESFGLAAILVSIISIIGPIGGLTYEYAIGISNSNSESVRVIKLSIKLSIISATVLSLIFFASLNLFPINNITKEHWILITITPLTIFFIVSNQAMTQWCIRLRIYNPLIASELSFSLITSLLKIIGGLISPTAVTLASITILGYAIRPGIIYWVLRKKIKSITKNKSIEIDIKLMKKYIEFPIYKAPLLTAGMLTSNLPIMILGSYFGASSSGLYNLTNSAVRQPVNIISNSFSKILQPDIFNLISNKRITSEKIFKISIKLAAIGITPLLICIYYSPKIFASVFGSDWESAGNFAQWILVKEYIGFISNPYIIAVNALNLQKTNLYVELFFTIFSLLFLIITAVTFNNALYAIAIYSCINCAKDICMNFITSKKIQDFNKLYKE